MAAIHPPSDPNEFPTTEINRGVLRTIIAARQCSESKLGINSVSYWKTGLLMMASTNDDSILLFDLEGKQKPKDVMCKKYGVANTIFANDTKFALHSSTKKDHAIRYISLETKSYIHYFPGHSENVTGLSIADGKTLFLSSSIDKTIRLWDIRSLSCPGVMETKGQAVAQFDPEGLIFAAAFRNSATIKLYDLRNFKHGPFLSFALPEDLTNVEWRSVRFSQEGRLMLICTNSNKLVLLDARTGAVQWILEAHKNDANLPLVASFSPDSKYVFVGSSDKLIYAYCTTTGKTVCKYHTPHSATPTIVEWNPVFLSFISAEKSMVLWNPESEDRVVECQTPIY
ncbi:unnamed protein product [Caenorhabditis angaria]|uniref:Anaphase-promoting complex subunit 4 WD40 domain-containing protein n=1 Tax=Caenorhabditis angaria TaxID=860376 RepID=A0A9P1MXJ8_9PELO|nr:unnamed protein product [Caenorhabditis angaria]